MLNFSKNFTFFVENAWFFAFFAGNTIKYKLRNTHIAPIPCMYEVPQVHILLYTKEINKKNENLATFLVIRRETVRSAYVMNRWFSRDKKYIHAWRTTTLRADSFPRKSVPIQRAYTFRRLERGLTLSKTPTFLIVEAVIYQSLAGKPQDVVRTRGPGISGVRVR